VTSWNWARQVIRRGLVDGTMNPALYLLPSSTLKQLYDPLVVKYRILNCIQFDRNWIWLVRFHPGMSWPRWRAENFGVFAFDFAGAGIIPAQVQFQFFSGVFSPLVLLLSLSLSITGGWKGNKFLLIESMLSRLFVCFLLPLWLCSVFVAIARIWEQVKGLKFIPASFSWSAVQSMMFGGWGICPGFPHSPSIHSP